jgi:hypothetical protein
VHHLNQEPKFTSKKGAKRNKIPKKVLPEKLQQHGGLME